MPSIFWTGKLSPSLKLLVNCNNVLAWVSGAGRDTALMKQRLQSGYNGAVTADVRRYDELGLEHYTKIARALLASAAIRGQTVLDVGCGTGILTLQALEQGARRVVCGDFSRQMLARCVEKAQAAGLGPERLLCQKLDAEALPFAGDTFGAVLSGMVLGLMPNQDKALAEMVRVLAPGGRLSVSTHAPGLYHEACEVAFRVFPKRLLLGYRAEFWPRREAAVARMLARAGLTSVQTQRLTWQEQFADGAAAYEFFAATSSAWWYAKLPPEQVAAVARQVRAAFVRKRVTAITIDVILAHGRKP